MAAKKIRIADIQTSELLYFDPDYEKSCYRFCRDRDIDCLPSLVDPSKYYLRDEATEGFSEESISEERIINGSENIFQASLLERFRHSPLLFVHSDGELSGVVHFCDYNKPAVEIYLFELLSDFERALRKLLVKSGLVNTDMEQYLVNTGKKQDKSSDLAPLPAFQGFYLINLIGLAQAKKIITIDPQVNKMRRMVMHNRDLVQMKDAYTDDYIYSFESFETFFNYTLLVHQELRKVNSRIAFMSD